MASRLMTARSAILRSALGLLLAAAGARLHAQEPSPREKKVRDDRARVEADAFWIYNDLPQAFTTAKLTGKPILVVLRCIPCTDCVKLDDEMVERDPVIRPLLDEFVCVRQISTNGLDLSLFQFDTDQSFAVFMLNGDGTIYGRFGTRSHRTDWHDDVSLAGMAKALQGALELHANYPANKASLAGKRGEPFEVDRPEQFESLSGEFTDRLNFGGNVLKSCIHCHQIGDARREHYRSAGDPIPEEILFPSPHPKIVGLKLDPDERATVESVAEGSAADEAGFLPGDQIARLDGQPLLSIADVQWTLDRVDPKGGQVTAEVQRGEKTVRLTLQLDDGWRQRGDLSWRASSWVLRRMATGGMRLEELPQSERDALEIPDGSMALVVNHVGKYGPHAAAMRAGVEEGDVIIEFDRRRDLLREADVLRHGVVQLRPGDTAPITLIRNGEKLELTLPMQP